MIAYLNIVSAELDAPALVNTGFQEPLLVHGLLNQFILVLHPASDHLGSDRSVIDSRLLLAVLNGRQSFLIVDDILLPGPDLALTFFDTTVKIHNIPVLGAICCCSDNLRSILEITTLAIFFKALLILSEHLLTPAGKCLTASVTSDDRLGEEGRITSHMFERLL